MHYIERCSQGGDLHDALHVGKSRLEWKAGGCRLAAQIALGLSKLHAAQGEHHCTGCYAAFCMSIGRVNFKFSE